MLDYDYDIDIIFKKLNVNVKKIYIIPYFPVEDAILTISTNKDYIQGKFITIDTNATNTISMKDISNEIQKYVKCEVTLRIVAGIFNNYMQYDNYTLLLTADTSKHIKLPNDIDTGRFISIINIIFYRCITWDESFNQCAVFTDIFINNFEQNNRRKIRQYLNDIYANAPKKIDKIILDFTMIIDLRIKLQVGIIGIGTKYRTTEGITDLIKLGIKIANVKDLYRATIAKICNNPDNVIQAFILELFNIFVLNNNNQIYSNNMSAIQNHIHNFLVEIDLNADNLDIYNKNGKFYEEFKNLFVEILNALVVFA